MEAEKYLKTGQVAKLLGVDRTTLQKWAKSGILIPAHKTGAGYNLYSQSQIKQFCQTAENLLPSAQNCGKSPTIKNRTAENLQQAATNCGKSLALVEPEKKRESIRLIPAKMLVMTNDKLTKELFRCTPEEYLRLFEYGGLLREKKLPKIGEIFTSYWLELVDDYTDKSPLTMFAKAVFTACVSEWIIGNRYTTVGVIFRHITGKSSGSNAQPSPAMKELILFCIRKMMCTILRVDMTEVCKHLNYNDGEPLILNSPILPCKYVEGITINGNKSETVIYFFDESPLLTIARVKNNQLLSVEPRLLNISKHSGSPKSISVRHCIIQRVLESFLHQTDSKIEPIIAFDYVFEVCGFINADSKKKCRVIHEVIEIFEELVSSGDIISFTIRKDGDKYQAVEFKLRQIS